MLAERLDEAWTKRRRVTAIDAVMRFADEGLILGAGTLLARRAGPGRTLAIDPHEDRLRALLAAAHQRIPPAESLVHLHKAALRWSEGQETLAAVHLALSRLDRLRQPEEDARRLFLTDGMLNAGVPANAIIVAVEASNLELLDQLEKYDPDQPRVPAGSGRQSGQWTSTGAAVGSAAGVGAPQPQSRRAAAGLTAVDAAATKPIAAIDACEQAQQACINLALSTSQRKNPLRIFNFGNCMAAGSVCDLLSWVIEDFGSPGDYGGVTFPHGGIVLINKGQLDRYYPPKPDGSNPLL